MMEFMIFSSNSFNILHTAKIFKTTCSSFCAEFGRMTCAKDKIGKYLSSELKFNIFFDKEIKLLVCCLM